MLPQEPNGADRHGETAMLKACRAGHTEMVQLLQYADADVNVCDHKGESPLMFACAEGHHDIVEFLLECGVEKDPANCWGETALHRAAQGAQPMQLAMSSTCNYAFIKLMA